MQSLLTELVIALVVRTRRVFYRSRPGRVLWISSLVLSLVALAIPYLPEIGLLEVVRLTWADLNDPLVVRRKVEAALGRARHRRSA